MRTAIVVGCGSYMDSGYGCPGEWRCLKAAGLGEGKFDAETMVLGFVKCACPGRSTAPNVGMTAKLAEMKPDVVHLSSCLATAKPGCPYATPEEMAEAISKTGIPVALGTHEYK